MSAWSEDRALLIVASSGRALAASAARRGLPVVVLDLYNDLDTRDLSLASRAVAGRNGRFDSRLLLAAAAELSPVQRCAGLICGSGFEARTGLLKKLAEGRTLFGNGPDTVAMVKDPARFFSLLDRLGIAHPAVTLEPPRDPNGWLVKRTGAAGGSHVRRAGKRHRAGPHRYFQRLESGRVLSALFAADGARARALGFNEQWTAGVPWCAPYCYGGAVTCTDLPQGIATEITQVLDRLVAATGLVGVNGLDFILDGDRPLVLEVNPRPTATIDLYDADMEMGVAALHLRACRGELPSAPALLRQTRAHAIVYAATAFRVPAHVSWPSWCTDLPEQGSLIPVGAPVCSVHCVAATARQARLLVQTRREQIEANLWAEAAA
jgi:predicted ATP-grasp superfamily ATP-dependent carboligase